MGPVKVGRIYIGYIYRVRKKLETRMDWNMSFEGMYGSFERM